MREIRKSGSEGGEPQTNAVSLPLFFAFSHPIPKDKGVRSLLSTLFLSVYFSVFSVPLWLAAFRLVVLYRRIA